MATAHLIRLLQLAHAAERAAAMAYRGHAASTRDPDERAAIRAIERDEWIHRRLVGQWLTALGAKPAARYEIRFVLIGAVIALACFVIGPFLATYFAGRLEGDNVHEYHTIAAAAVAAGHPELVAGARHMANVEAEHEAVLLAMVARHPALAWFRRRFNWPQPAPTTPAAINTTAAA